MVVKLCTCLLCIHFGSLLAFPFRNDLISSVFLYLTRFKFKWMCECTCIKIVACTIYEHKPNAKWYFETLSKKETPVQRKTGGREEEWVRERELHELWSVFISHSRVDFVSCLLLLRLFSWFICWTARYSSLVPKVSEYGDLPYLFIHFFVCLAFAHSLSICFVYTAFLLSLNPFSIFCFVDINIQYIIHSRSALHSKRRSDEETNEERERERKTYGEQIFLRTIQITISVVWC